MRISGHKKRIYETKRGKMVVMTIEVCVCVNRPTDTRDLLRVA